MKPLRGRQSSQKCERSGERSGRASPRARVYQRLRSLASSVWEAIADGKSGGYWFRFQLFFQICRNGLSVESAVFDEDFARTHARHNHAREVNTWHAALERLRIDHWLLVVVAAEPASQAADELEIRMIARQGKDPVIRQRHLSLRRVEYDAVGRDLLHGAVEIRLHLAGLNAVLDVGLDPVLNRRPHTVSTMHQRHARAVAPKLKSSDGRRVLAAYDQYVEIEEGVRLAVIMQHLGKILAGNVHQVGAIVIAGS